MNYELPLPLIVSSTFWIAKFPQSLMEPYTAKLPEDVFLERYLRVSFLSFLISFVIQLFWNEVEK